MDCNYWSCFVHEDERLLIGGVGVLQFETIRNIVQSENYTQYVKALNIMDQMMKGVALAGIKPCSDDVVCLKGMMKFEIDVGAENHSFVPKYIQSLFHHFLTKKTEIFINLSSWKNHFSSYYHDFDLNIYGYKKFGELFGLTDGEGIIDFTLLIKLFPNLKVFTVGDASPGEVSPSLELSYDFVVKMLECIEYLNKSSSAPFCRFEIIRPASSIDDFIQSVKNEFEMNGWTLKNGTFMGKGIFSEIRSIEMLSIEKLKK